MITFHLTMPLLIFVSLWHPVSVLSMLECFPITCSGWGLYSPAQENPPLLSCHPERRVSV